MKTERRLVLALKEMLEEKPLDEISVYSLTKKSKIKRQTFYYHFHNIYDLLSLVYLEEKIDGIDEAKTTKEMLNSIFVYYSKNTKLIEATLDSAGKDLFSEFLFNNCYQTILRIIENNDKEKLFKPSVKKNVARYYAFAYSNTLIYYFETSREITLGSLLNQFNFIDENEILNSIKKLSKSKEIKK